MNTYTVTIVDDNDTEVDQDFRDKQQLEIYLTNLIYSQNITNLYYLRIFLKDSSGQVVKFIGVERPIAKNEELLRVAVFEKPYSEYIPVQGIKNIDELIEIINRFFDLHIAIMYRVAMTYDLYTGELSQGFRDKQKLEIYLKDLFYNQNITNILNISIQLEHSSGDIIKSIGIVPLKNTINESYAYIKENLESLPVYKKFENIGELIETINSLFDLHINNRTVSIKRRVSFPPRTVRRGVRGGKRRRGRRISRRYKK